MYQMGYFAMVRNLYRSEEFMFVRAETADGQGANTPGWYPMRMQLDIKYWQRQTCRAGTCWYVLLRNDV
jgi:hypothetical protein